MTKYSVAVQIVQICSAKKYFLIQGEELVQQVNWLKV